MSFIIRPPFLKMMVIFSINGMARGVPEVMVFTPDFYQPHK